LNLDPGAIEFPTEYQGKLNAYITTVPARMDRTELELVARLAGRSNKSIHDLPVNRLQDEELHRHEGSFAAVPSL
jgi:hypothetical protein